MTPHGQRPVPADMLLIAERRRRNAGSDRSPMASEEILVSDEDQLIEVAAPGSPPSNAAGELILYRPMAQVTLVHISWSGPIDHAALQSALACHPKDPSMVGPRLGAFAGTPFAAYDAAGAALEVTLAEDDLAMIEAVSSSGDARAAPAELVRVARLPERLTGAEATTIQAVSHVLAAYRRAALAEAWRGYLCSPESAQLHRERDETAVAVLSTLRALLGER